MPRRSQRGAIVRPEVFLEDLRTGRKACIKIRDETKINSPEFIAAGEVMGAIDRLAEVLTGDSRVFHVKPHGGGE